jgi:hypothetical protein
MALSFPPSPTVGQTYTDSNSVVWQYDGVVWNVVTGSTKKVFNGIRAGFTAPVSLTDTLTVVSFTSEVYDTGNYWINSNPTRITIPQTGYYNINSVIFSSSSGAGYMIQLKKNGSTTISSVTINANQATEFDQVLFFDANDYIELFATETTTSGSITADSFVEVTQVGLSIGSGVSSYQAFSGVKTELTSAFSTSTIPSAVLWSTTEFNINANAESLTYWSSGEPGKITVKVTAYYQLIAYIRTNNAGGTYTVNLRKNGTTSVATGTLGVNETATIDITQQFDTNDYIELVVSESTNAGAITVDSYLQLIRMGY